MRRVLGIGAVMGGLATSAVALAVTHLPAPSAMGDREADTRAVWVGIGEVAKKLAVFYPSFLDGLRSDKTIHVAIFIGPGFFWAAAIALLGRLDRRATALLLVGLASWAVLDEWSQHLLGRDGQVGDVVANLIGGAIGVGAAAVGRLLVRRVRGRL